MLLCKIKISILTNVEKLKQIFAAAKKLKDIQFIIDF